MNCRIKASNYTTLHARRQEQSPLRFRAWRGVSVLWTRIWYYYQIDTYQIGNKTPVSYYANQNVSAYVIYVESRAGFSEEEAPQPVDLIA